MGDPWTDHPFDRRERVRLDFREAGRELRWAMSRYGDARQAIDSGGVSIAELYQARQAWCWALMEWVRTLVSREETLDEARSGPGDGRERPLSGADGRPSPPPGTLQAARRQVEVLSGQYERVRYTASSDEVALARGLWARALAAWARTLIATEEAADHDRLDRLEAGGRMGAALSGEDRPSRRGGGRGSARSPPRAGSGPGRPTSRREATRSGTTAFRPRVLSPCAGSGGRSGRRRSP
ncbi:hypothetical protein [Planomonospora algeriensis]